MKVKLVTAALFTCAVVVFSGCGPSGSMTQMQVASQSCILDQAVYNARVLDSASQTPQLEFQA
jgi:hypothetical protein